MMDFLTGVSVGVLGTAITWGIVNKTKRDKEMKKVKKTLDKVEELKLKKDNTQAEVVEG